ncbi:MAG: hypothetical protein Kow00117_19980 [Phototrophicales bacterium]|nr:MAG: hypothetical protein D6711_03785 [Chloroflexota bacterium]
MPVDHDLHIQTQLSPRQVLSQFFAGLEVHITEGEVYEDGRVKYYVAANGFDAYAIQRLPDETVNQHFLGFVPTVLLWFRLTEDETAVEIMRMIAQRAKQLAESTQCNTALFFNNGIIPMFLYVNQEYQFDNT